MKSYNLSQQIVLVQTIFEKHKEKLDKTHHKNIGCQLVARVLLGCTLELILHPNI